MDERVAERFGAEVGSPDRAARVDIPRLRTQARVAALRPEATVRPIAGGVRIFRLWWPLEQGAVWARGAGLVLVAQALVRAVVR